MTFHDGELTSQEVHETLLRTTADDLELGVELFELRLEYLEREAQAFLSALLLKGEIKRSS